MLVKLKPVIHLFFLFQICSIEHADESYFIRKSSSAEASCNNCGMCKGSCVLFPSID